MAPGAFMKPEWRKKIYGEGGRREAPPQTSEEARARQERSQEAAVPEWIRAFRIWAPTEKDVAREERKRSVQRHREESARAEREYFQRVAEEKRRRRSGQAPPPPAGQAPGGQRPWSRYGQPPPAPGGPGSQQQQQQQRYGSPPSSAAPPPSSSYGGAREGRIPGPASPSGNLDADRIWDGIRQVRRDPRFRGSYGVGQISRAGRTQAERAIDLAEFLKTPEVIREYRPEELWTRWAEPALGRIVQELNAARPADLPGRLIFDFTGDGAFGLIYTETPRP